MRAGIPTEYAGIRMRSRLEAQWAAFFDLLGWPWQYEPFDLNGYIPDFLIPKESDRGPIVIEVKPETCIEDLRKHINRIKNSGWQNHILVVGTSLFERDGLPRLGVCDHFPDPGYYNCPSVNSCNACGRLYPTVYGPACYFCGNEWRPGDAGADDELIRSAFVTAKNRVQWKGEFGA